MTLLDTTKPLLPEALAAARNIYTQLPDVPAPGLSRIYYHWAVEDYGCTDSAYNLEVYLPSGANEFAIKITNTPLGNVAGTPEAESDHTYRRNTGAVGVAISGLVGATYSNLGAEPVTLHSEEFLCAAGAAVAKKYGIECDAPASGVYYPSELASEHTIMTHSEAALTTPSTDDNVTWYAHYYCYGVNNWRANAAGNPVPGSEAADPDCRWDLAEDEASGTPPDENAARTHADLLRARTHQYGAAL